MLSFLLPSFFTIHDTGRASKLIVLISSALVVNVSFTELRRCFEQHGQEPHQKLSGYSETGFAFGMSTSNGKRSCTFFA